MGIDFDIGERRVGSDTHIVSVSGEIDLFTAPEFKQAVIAAIDGGADRVIVDLAEVSFIDSSSLGVLIGAHRRLKGRGGELIVACDREPILKTFKITGLDGVFRLVASVDDAVNGQGAAA